MEENPSFCRINVCIHPLTPSCECLLKSKHPIHIFDNLASNFNEIPSAKSVYSVLLPSYLLYKKVHTNIDTYGCEGPLRFHQCQVLKMRVSIPFHNLPPSIDSSFKTLPICSLTVSTRYTLRSSITLTP